jgi:hypothetical protein
MHKIACKVDVHGSLQCLSIWNYIILLYSIVFYCQMYDTTNNNLHGAHIFEKIIPQLVKKLSIFYVSLMFHYHIHMSLPQVKRKHVTHLKLSNYLHEVNLNEKLLHVRFETLTVAVLKLKSSAM